MKHAVVVACSAATSTWVGWLLCSSTVVDAGIGERWSRVSLWSNKAVVEAFRRRFLGFGVGWVVCFDSSKAKMQLCGAVGAGGPPLVRWDGASTLTIEWRDVWRQPSWKLQELTLGANRAVVEWVWVQ